MRTPNPAIAETLCWQQLGFVRHRQPFIYFFLSIGLKSTSCPQSTKLNSIFLNQSRSLIFFLVHRFVFKVQIVSERELCPRVANCPRKQIFFSVPDFEFLSQLSAECNLSPSCKLSAEKSRFAFFLFVDRIFQFTLPCRVAEPNCCQRLCLFSCGIRRA